MNEDDSLANVTGRAWLAAELDRIANQLCTELTRDYVDYRRGRTKDRKEFVDSIEQLKVEAFLIARAVLHGGCDMRGVISVFNWFARLDNEVHRPDMNLGRGKIEKDSKTGFSSKHDQHERWCESYLEAHRELEATGKKRLKTTAARMAIHRLALNVTPGALLQAVRENTQPKK